ncbi:MAG TPA: hypothetical protein PK453_08980 [Leptospiraceae bacterium]|nr:hypothetical protein [Leptospiraceae bacterium]HMY66040.1 hypothetical protein [Leptospiraceae bacterium]HNF13789.1 hypothetical protein [Leptospiraceae bacterium]HNF24685.1 hypothetical protein [Leptospiraceae bacterium]HNH11044.1 hypothetical protein [Leptospiraceae bacterium]
MSFLKKGKFINAATAGLVPAALELLLIVSVEPSIDRWVLFQAVFFWFTCGFSVYRLCSEERIISSSVGYTVFLNIPWYTAESAGKNKPEHLVPLVCVSILQGIIIGILAKKLKQSKIGREIKYDVQSD